MKGPLTLVAWLGLSAALWGQAPEPATITTTGVGKVKVKPDGFRISFTLSAQADTVKEAREKVAVQAKKVAEGLRQMRLELEVQQGQGPIESVSSPFADRSKPEAYRFRATHTFVVVGRSADPDPLRTAASRVVELALEHDAAFADTAAERGFRGEGPPRVLFFRQDDAEAQRKALALATADALANAHAIADGAKVKIADIVAIASREPRPAELGVARKIVSADADIEIICVVEVKVRIQK